MHGLVQSFLCLEGFFAAAVNSRLLLVKSQKIYCRIVALMPFLAESKVAVIFSHPLAVNSHSMQVSKTKIVESAAIQNAVHLIRFIWLLTPILHSSWLLTFGNRMSYFHTLLHLRHEIGERQVQHSTPISSEALHGLWRNANLYFAIDASCRALHARAPAAYACDLQPSAPGQTSCLDVYGVQDHSLARRRYRP